jgi:hypothetical protein
MKTTKDKERRAKDRRGAFYQSKVKRIGQFYCIDVCEGRDKVSCKRGGSDR